MYITFAKKRENKIFRELNFNSYNFQKIVRNKVKKNNLSSNPGTALHPCLRRR